MRIGVIYLGRHGPGGPIAFELASNLSRKADVFAVVSKNADHIDLWHDSKIPLVETPTFETGMQAFASCFNPVRLRKLSRNIAARQPDVLLYPMVHPWTPFLQRYLAAIPHVIAVHDPVAHPGFIHRMSSFWESISARRAKRTVVLANVFVERMRERGIPAERIDVIPHPVFSFYDRFPSKPEGPLEAVEGTLLFFGRITAYKGLDVLLQAFRSLSAQKIGLQLIIVGEGDLRPYVHLIDGIRNITVVNRWVGDGEVAEIFKSAAIVVVPYVSASQSGVIALAANFGRPVIATRVGAIPEQIREGETGLLIEPESAEALASAIDLLLNDRNLRERLGRQLASDARAASNWDAASDAYLESCRKAAEP